MVYTLTDKLKFGENPKIEINGKLITVKADAKTVLKVMDAINKNDEVGSALEAYNLLFTDKDKKTVDALNLSMEDFLQLLETAITLASGGNPDDTEKQE